MNILKKFFTKIFRGSIHRPGELIYDVTGKYPVGIVMGDPNEGCKKPFKRFLRNRFYKYWIVIPTKGSIIDIEFSVPFIDTDQSELINNEFFINGQSFLDNEEEYISNSKDKNIIASSSPLIKMCNTIKTEFGPMLLPSYSSLLYTFTIIKNITEGKIELDDEIKRLVPTYEDILRANGGFYAFPSSSQFTYDRRKCLAVLSNMWPPEGPNDLKYQYAISCGFKTYSDFCKKTMRMIILPILELW